MPPVYVSVPKGVFVVSSGAEGGQRGSNQHSSRVRLPEGTTEYSFQAYVKLPEEAAGRTSSGNLPIYIPAIPVTASRADVQARIDAIVADFLAGSEGIGQYDTAFTWGGDENE